MVKAIKQELTVQKDNMIEIHSLSLKPGVRVEVILLLDEEIVPAKNDKGLLSLLGAGKGSFASHEEADIFIRGEREQWE